MDMSNVVMLEAVRCSLIKPKRGIPMSDTKRSVDRIRLSVPIEETGKILKLIYDNDIQGVAIGPTKSSPLPKPAAPNASPPRTSTTAPRSSNRRFVKDLLVQTIHDTPMTRRQLCARFVGKQIG